MWGREKGKSAQAFSRLESCAWILAVPAKRSTEARERRNVSDMNVTRQKGNLRQDSRDIINKEKQKVIRNTRS
jgi:hypothetical protein